jgi:hypothetical protein
MGKSNATQSADQTERDLEAARNTGSSGAMYKPAGRWVVENGTRRWYTGEGLVGGEQLVTTGYYDLTADTNRIYAGWSPTQRVSYMKRLVDGGFLSAGSVGDVASELNAVEKLLYYSNIVGRVWGEALDIRLSSQPVVRSGGQRTVQVSSPQDLAKVAQSVAENTIGRGLTEEELNTFVQSYQQQEMAYQRAGSARAVQPPSMDVAAERFIQESQPGEESAYRYLGYMNKLFSSIGAV